ncbi:dnaJ homolog subfamily C member 22 [Orussus abietinus]|uniref:dnaJ homolog subfamily C member 22 n=1 Tax=Orussus abietinus TaxID=222816 RepID=UPI0006256D86|nr:dnaJ homolog subfamily C member 22 [Orussus abietinus]
MQSGSWLSWCLPLDSVSFFQWNCPQSKSRAMPETEKFISKDREKAKTRNEGPARKRKSVFVAYVFWLFGGVFGAHHVYLERDDHAFVWFCTLGGYFGIGWLRDLFKIPGYVADANEDPEYREWLKTRVRANRKPPFSVVRFLGALVVSYVWGQLVYIAIPEDEVHGINFRPLIIFIPAAVALGTWVVGNIGREQGSIWLPLLTAYCCYPTLYYIGDDSTWMGLMVTTTAFVFDSFSKEWRLRPRKKRSLPRRLAILLLASVIYLSLWGSYFYFNATITDSEGEEIKISEAVKHFLTSPIWLDLKTNLEEAWRQVRHQGFWATWAQLVDLTDPRGEINAYRVLELSQTSSQSEITAKWRALSREHHPDKVKGSEEEKRRAQEKFMEIQQAYEILSSARNRRQRRNRRTE